MSFLSPNQQFQSTKRKRCANAAEAVPFNITKLFTSLVNNDAHDI